MQTIDEIDFYLDKSHDFQISNDIVLHPLDVVVAHDYNSTKKDALNVMQYFGKAKLGFFHSGKALKKNAEDFLVFFNGKQYCYLQTGKKDLEKNIIKINSSNLSNKKLFKEKFLDFIKKIKAEKLYAKMRWKDEDKESIEVKLSTSADEEGWSAIPLTSQLDLKEAKFAVFDEYCLSNYFNYYSFYKNSILGHAVDEVSFNVLALEDHPFNSCVFSKLYFKDIEKSTDALMIKCSEGARSAQAPAKMLIALNNFFKAYSVGNPFPKLKFGRFNSKMLLNSNTSVSSKIIMTSYFLQALVKIMKYEQNKYF